MKSQLSGSRNGIRKASKGGGIEWMRDCFRTTIIELICQSSIGIGAGQSIDKLPPDRIITIEISATSEPYIEIGIIEQRIAERLLKNVGNALCEPHLQCKEGTAVLR